MGGVKAGALGENMSGMGGAIMGFPYICGVGIVGRGIPGICIGGAYI